MALGAYKVVVVLGASVLLATGCSGGGTPFEPATNSPSTSTSTSSPGGRSTTTTTVAGPDAAPGRRVVSFDVGGVQRTAVVVVPKSLTGAAPLVFAFHGHGGSGANFERKFDIEALWPEAVVVYPDGLVGHEGITDPQGVKSGWQTTSGESGDRDIALYDSMLAWLRSRLPIDSHRIYLMGHSNGSAFVSLLLNRRGDAIAATANMSSQPPARLLATDPVRSMFMSMGINDPIVPYANQRRSIPRAELKLGVDASTAKVDGDLRSETGPRGIELETYIYAGGHEPPPAVARLVVEFFQRHELGVS